jgi:hypothetical protein
MTLDQGTLHARVEWAENTLAIPLDRIQVLDFQPEGGGKRPMVDSQTQPHHLRLLNGDHLSGVYLGQDGAKVLFRPGWQTTPLRIHGKYVDRLLCGHQNPPSTNGDTVSGRLLEKTGGELLLDTGWSDRIRIRMPQVSSLRKRLPGEDLLERGPSSMDDWVYSNRRETVLTGDETHFRASMDGWWLSRRGMVQKRLPEVQGSFRFSVRIHVSTSGRTSVGTGIALTGLPNEEGGYRMLQITQRGDQWILNVTDPQRSVTQHIDLSSVVPDENGDVRFVFEFNHSEKHLQIGANGAVAHEW